MCIQFAQCALRATLRGEHAGVDYELPMEITGGSWDAILQLSYKAAAVVLPEGDIGTSAGAMLSVDHRTQRRDTMVKEAMRLTTLLRLFWPQRAIDGHRNIWVVKAPDAGR